MTVTTSTCLASPPAGWAVTSAVRAPALRATSTSVCAVGEIARPGGGDEEIACAERRRRHVAPDRDVAAHVKEPHGEAAHLQALASEAEDDDALRRDDGLDKPVERVLRHGGEHARKIVQRAFRQLAPGFRSSFPPVDCSLSDPHTDPRLTIGHSTLICRGRLGRAGGGVEQDFGRDRAHLEMGQEDRRQRRMQVLGDFAIVIAHDRDVVRNPQARAHAAPRSSRPPSGRWRRRSRSAALLRLISSRAAS